jgi:hypothetical protein
MEGEGEVKFWAVMFNHHVHTDADQRLAIFRSRDLARAWKRKHGVKGCYVWPFDAELIESSRPDLCDGCMAKRKPPATE